MLLIIHKFDIILTNINTRYTTSRMYASSKYNDTYLQLTQYVI